MVVYTDRKGGRLSQALHSVMESKDNSKNKYHFVDYDRAKVIQEIGFEKLIFNLRQMLTVRHLETRAEAAYLQGKIGGFFHAYMGQEAIQTACLEVFGQNNWWAASYRCHALAYLTGASPNEIMAEFFGRSNGNAKGRGGSMHLYTDRLLGGTGIVGGQVPLAIGAALSIQYQEKNEEISFCFLGDGAVPQGTFHESLNLAALWNLPCVVVIENNQWGMGTAVNRAVAASPIAESFGPAYGIESVSIEGLDFIASYAGFKRVQEIMKAERRPILVEAVTERFRGHSISDPAQYRTREALKEAMNKDPIIRLKQDLLDANAITEEGFKALDKDVKELIIEAVKHAEESPWPDPIVLGEGVMKEEGS